mmetsp:Transcript_15042/g.17171  ORF Transcript_15042/g.17171 Transcript_15042/m.17171 type:complete len:500 (+) Transcript_15042:365-1864(+)
MALIDSHNESYGSNENASNGIRNDKLGIDYLTYNCSDIVFDPKGCSWKGTVNFDCDLLENKSKDCTIKRIVGSFPFRAQCETVLTQDQHKDQDHKYSTVKEDESNQVKMMHYCIDFEASLKATKRSKGRGTVPSKIIVQTLNHIEYDVARALYWLTMPEFPEGCKGDKFRPIYQLNSQIQNGSYGTVCVGTHRKTLKKVAVKCIIRKNLKPRDDVAIHREVNVLASLNHENICPIIDFFIEDDCYYIVMELMQGGDVFDRIGHLKAYDESIARDFCINMLKAIDHLHDNNIAHCDLKHKNLLLKSKDDHTSVMLADFGFATRVFGHKSLDAYCGTPYFVAPEIIERKGYDERADMWSTGVIMYCLLSGDMPFTGKRHVDLYKAISSCDYNFNGDAWKNVSADAKDLISNLLVTDPDERYTAKDALKSRWISQNDGRMLSNNNLEMTRSNLSTFNARMKLRTAILTVQSVARWKIVVHKNGNTCMDEKIVEKKDEQEVWV